MCSAHDAAAHLRNRCSAAGSRLPKRATKQQEVGTLVAGIVFNVDAEHSIARVAGATAPARDGCCSRPPLLETVFQQMAPLVQWSEVFEVVAPAVL